MEVLSLISTHCQVLMEEWLALRARGIPTPSIVTWANSPVASYPDGHMTTWQWLLDHVYNNKTRASLLWSRPSQPVPPNGQPLKRTFFVPFNSLYVSRSATPVTLVQSACRRGLVGRR